MLLKIKNWSFRWKLIIYSVGINGIVSISAAYFIYDVTLNSQREIADENSLKLSSSLALQIKPAIEFDDSYTAEEILEDIVRFPNKECIRVWKLDYLSENSRPILFAEKKKNNSEFLFDEPPKAPYLDSYSAKADRTVIRKVIYSDSGIKIGFVELLSNLESVRIFEGKFLQITIFSWCTFIFVMIFATLWLEKSLTKPLIELVSVAEKVSLENNLLVRAKKLSDDEFGKLTAVFNKMLDSIRDANNQLIASNKEMENRVKQRTEDLDLANQKLQSEIKERIKKNIELLDLQNQMSKQDRLASVGQVSSNIAHELRNPMGAIRNSIYFLRKFHANSEKSIKHLDLIDQELSSTDEVIQKLLNISKGQKLQQEKHELEKICQEALALLNTKKRVRFEYNSNPKDISIFVDKILFRQILLNLFINSIQSITTQEDVKISVKASAEANYVNIYVSDNGSGIPPKYFTQVFEPLFTKKVDGFGLGLPLCSDILERHKGTIEIENSSSKGTTFKIQIPNESSKKS